MARDHLIAVLTHPACRFRGQPRLILPVLFQRLAQAPATISRIRAAVFPG